MRPLLIGMNNPVSTRPGHELYPLPEGCTGHRLWKMLQARTGAGMHEYRDAFERRNLVIGREWDRLAARARAYEMVTELSGSGRTIVLLGQSVREAFDWVIKNEFRLQMQELPPLIVHPQQVAGCTWRQIPHPSGRNMWYQEPKNVRVVELLMEELYVAYREKVS